MKKNFKYAMMMATALVLGFSSCSSDDNDPIEGGGSHVVEGKVTKAKISIQAPKTYASTPLDGTPEESNIGSVDVYIYNAKSGILENSKNFSSIDTSVTPWKVGEMQTTTGDKKVFIIANKPSAIEENHVNTVEKLTNLAHKFSLDDLATNGEFVMSSIVMNKTFTTIVTPEGGTPTIPSTNTVAAEVNRMVAKLSVRNKDANTPNLTIDGGKLNPNLSFGVGQVNKYSYLAQNISNDNVVDPNYHNDVIGWSTGEGLTGSNTVAKYEAVNAHDTTDDNLNFVYTLENTALNKKKGDLTYVAIQAEFIPDSLQNYNTTKSKWEVINNSASTVAKTFHKITTKDNSFFFESEDLAKQYIVEVLAANENKIIAINTEIIAEADAIIQGGSSTSEEIAEAQVKKTAAEAAIEKANNKITELKNTTPIVKYTNGLCYYTVYPNKENNYDVLRNDFYKITINKIMALGDNDPGPLTPEDGEDVIGLQTDIDVTITVNPWNLWSEDVDLKPQS